MEYAHIYFEQEIRSILTEEFNECAKIILEPVMIILN